ncbi:TPA: AIDA repeat-containing protein [Escherichia coli]|nr:autotransporter outer membrane beta-barrel domain-containing protein [Escherichia coli]HCO2787174.1 AIDA repeat-containing protein [Escherichia coli]
MNRISRYYFHRSVLSLLIAAMIYAPPGMTAFTSNVIGVVNDETVDGSQRVDERGTTNNAHIINHGNQEVYGGISNGSVIDTGGHQEVSGHGSYQGQANNTVINGGSQTISEGGISTGTIINDKGTMSVLTNAKADATRIDNGGAMDVAGNATNTIINGGTQNIYNHGIATGTNINSGTQNIKSGGKADTTNISSGSKQVVEKGGTATGSNIRAGGTLIVDTGGIAHGVYLDTGSALVANTGAGTDIDGYQRSSHFTITGGRAEHVVLENTGQLTVVAQTSAVDTIVDAGGKLIVHEEAVAYTTRLNNGGILDVREKGSATGIQQSSQGALVATTRATRVTGTRADGVAFSIEQGAANNILLTNGGVLTVESDTTSAKTQVNAGGREIVKTKATATGTTLTGGEQIVEGVANETTINDGGIQTVSANGEAIKTTINEGGTLTVNDNGKATDIVQNSGAALQTSTANGIEISGTHQYGTFSIASNLATNMLLENGGNLLVLAGTEARDSTVDKGGAMQNLGQDSATKVNSGGQYTLGRSKDEFQALARAEDLQVAGGTPNPNPNPNPDPTPEPTPTPVPEKRITPSTAAVLNMAATLPLVFDAELNSIRERLNIMKASPHNNNVWGTTYNTRNNVTTDAGAGFEQTLTGMTVGIDSRNDIPEGIATLGAFMGYSHSHIGFDRGGHGSVGSYSLGGYASWEHESGFYLDGIVKLNRFESNVAGKMSSGGAANGSYHSNGLGGHIETGMRFTDGNWNLTPYASLTGFTADNPEYHLSNGMGSKSVDTRSIYRELGATLSYNMRLGNGMEVEPWLKAAVRKEFVDDNRVKVNNDGNFVNDLSGRRGIYQAGIKASFSSSLSGHLGVGYSHGAGVESPWNAVAGANWSF